MELTIENGILIHAEGEEEVIEIPESVREIGEKAFKGFIHLREVHFPSELKKIGAFAFAQCKKLECAPIPKNVESIGSRAFWDCKELTEVELPDSVRELGDGAFSGCKNLKAMRLPAHITSIPDSFLSYTGIEEIFIPDSVTQIDEYAFSNCVFSKIDIPVSVRMIGRNAFSSCTKLIEISIPEGVEEIPFSTFMHCHSLKHVHLPESLKVIGEYAFSECDNLEEVRIPAGVTKIGHKAFGSTGYNLTKLKKVNLPQGIEAIEEGLFSYSSIEEITIPEGVTRIEASAFEDCKILTHVSFPESLKEIHEKAFRSTALTEVILPAGVNMIGRAAFTECGQLKKAYLPDAVDHIGGYAFNDVPEGFSISLPGSVRFVSDNIFGDAKMVRDRKIIVEIRGKIGTGFSQTMDQYKGYDCFVLTGMLCSDIPENKRFSACCSIMFGLEQGITVPSEVLESYITYLRQNKTVWLRKTSMTEAAQALYRALLREKIPNLKDMDKLMPLAGNNHFIDLAGDMKKYADQIKTEVPESIAEESENKSTKRKKEPSSGCSRWVVSRSGDMVISLEDTKTTVIFPTEINGQKIIGIDDGFTFLSGGKQARNKVKSISIPEGYRSVGKEAFINCGHLKNIELPDTLEIIGEKAFEKCEELEELKLPSNLKEIGNLAFNYMNIKRVIADSLDHLLSVRMLGGGSCPLGTDSVLMIGEKEIWELDIPESVREIGDYAFDGFKGLKAVHFPKGLRRIGNSAFRQCTNITKIITPEDLEEIGEYAFFEDEGLSELIIEGADTKIGRAAFSFCGDIEYVEYHYTNPVEEGSLPFEYTTIRRLVVHGTRTEQETLMTRIQWGSLGSVLYREETNDKYLRARSFEQLKNDLTDPDDPVSLKGLTFVAEGPLEYFPEPPEFYKYESKYYRYKDWWETGDVFEGYREVKKYPKHEDLKAFVRLRGGRVTSSVSGKTDYLISDRKQTDMVKEAKKRNIPVITEQEFLRMALNHEFETK